MSATPSVAFAAAGVGDSRRWGWLPVLGSPRYNDVMLALLGIFVLGPLGGVTASYMNFSIGFFVGGGQVVAGILGSTESLVYVSAMTPREIARLVSTGRLTLHKDVGEWLAQAFSLPGTRLQPLSVEIAVASTRLPGTPHGDPADRIIVATARYLGAQLVTADGPLLEYGDSGHVRTVKART